MMKACFGIEKEIKQQYGTPPIGNFAMESQDPMKSVHWDHCREQFAAKFNELVSGFFFAHPENKGVDVANFLVKFEKIVNLDSLDNSFSFFSKTNKNAILWVEPAQFWRSCAMKRSLLTILLRIGMNYDSQADNFDDVLFGDQFKENFYVRETKSATLRFMFGFTQFTGQKPIAALQPQTVIKHGWREEFQKIDETLIRRRLVSPNESKESSLVGLESLWA